MSKSKKAAALTGDLLAKKGQGETNHVLGVPQRGAASEREKLEPLNFRMPSSFVQEFKAYAAATDRKGTALLRAAFKALREKEGRDAQ